MIMFYVKIYFTDELFLFRECGNNMVSKCISRVLMNDSLNAYHTTPVGGHRGGIKRATKVLQSGYFC